MYYNELALFRIRGIDMANDTNPHKEHRDRVRKEFLENGFNDATPPHKIIEMLLFYSIPRKDTNELAHALLNRFGSIAGILEATHEELMRVEGIGQNSATLLKLILPICRYYQNNKISQNTAPKTMDSLGEILIKKHFGFTKEVFAITTFNNKGHIIAFDILNSGDVSSVGISTRSVIEKIIERKAVSAVISHNHPNGNALPSVTDIEMTKRIVKALSHISVPLLDHIIVTEDDFVSLSQSQQFSSIFKQTTLDYDR